MSPEAQAHADRRFFLSFVVVAWILVFAGFVSAVNDRFAGRADYPAPVVLQLHVVLTTAWLLLLTLQVLLVRSRRRALHAPLGAAGSPTDLATAERFIDAFYSFDRAELEPLLAAATAESRGEMLFYQGWAQGAHYRILRRRPCRLTSAGVAECPVTVEDDLMKAMGIDFNVIDTFQLRFENGAIASITTTSDDPPARERGEAWIRSNHPDLIREPCIGYFAGGPTPAACARAMVQGLGKFAKSPDFALADWLKDSRWDPAVVPSHPPT